MVFAGEKMAGASLAIIRLLACALRVLGQAGPIGGHAHCDAQSHLILKSTERFDVVGRQTADFDPSFDRCRCMTMASSFAWLQLFRCLARSGVVISRSDVDEAARPCVLSGAAKINQHIAPRELLRGMFVVKPRRPAFATPEGMSVVGPTRRTPVLILPRSMNVGRGPRDYGDVAANGDVQAVQRAPRRIRQRIEAAAWSGVFRADRPLRSANRAS